MAYRDLLARADVISALTALHDQWHGDIGRGTLSLAINKIRSLPSAKPAAPASLHPPAPHAVLIPHPDCPLRACGQLSECRGSAGNGTAADDDVCFYIRSFCHLCPHSRKLQL